MTLIDRLARFLLPATADGDVGDYPYVASDVALYQRTLHGDGGALDAQTWDDMLLPQYSAQLARGTSILGQQELHRRLHAPADGGAQVAASAARVGTLVDDGGLRRQLLTACEGLRRADREVSETLFGAALAPAPRWAPWLPWLPVAFLLSAVLALASGFLPLWGVTLGLWLSLSLVQIRFGDAASEWARVLKTLQQMLRAHTLLSKVDGGMTAELRDDAARAGKVNRGCLLYTSPSPRDGLLSRMPSSA